MIHDSSETLNHYRHNGTSVTRRTQSGKFLINNALDFSLYCNGVIIDEIREEQARDLLACLQDALGDNIDMPIVAAMQVAEVREWSECPTCAESRPCEKLIVMTAGCENWRPKPAAERTCETCGMSKTHFVCSLCRGECWRPKRTCTTCSEDREMPGGVKCRSYPCPDWQPELKPAAERTCETCLFDDVPCGDCVTLSRWQPKQEPAP